MSKTYAIWKKTGALLICLLAQSMTILAAPLSIDQAVDMALQNNLAIKLADNSKQQAQYTLQSTEGGRKISVDASNTFYLKQIHQNSANSTNITLSLPLYNGGKLDGNIENAKADVTIADQDLKKTVQDTRLKALSAYYDVIKTHKVQLVDQETVDNYVLHLNDVKVQYSAGNVAKSDVLRSEVELTDAQQTLMQADVSHKVAINTLKNVLVWKGTETPEFIDEFQIVPEARTLDECIDYAKNNRPDLAGYRLAVEKAKRSVDIARAAKKPEVSLSAGTGWNSSVLPSEDSSSLYVGVTTSWNVFDSHITDANIKKAQSVVAAANLTLSSQEDTVELAVKEYYMEMKEAEKRMETTQVAIHKAEEDYMIAEVKYKVGEGVLLDVIDAQLALTTAKNNYIEAQYDYTVYKAKLENAMGLN